jgi:Domain of unknown function (DUF4148)
MSSTQEISIMLKVHWIAGAAMVSLASLAAAQEPAALTRAEVTAEMMRARAAGEVDISRELSSDGGVVMAARSATGARGRAFSAPGLTRAQVRAELDRARASGELNRTAPELGSRH